MGESTGHRNQMILENSSTSIEHQSNSSNHESSNPLLSMLTNLGMNVGGIDVSPNELTNSEGVSSELVHAEHSH